MLMQSKKELFDIFWSIEFPACFKAFNHIFLLKAKFLLISHNFRFSYL